MAAKKKILVADDQQEVRTLVRETFHNYRVIEALDGERAVLLAVDEQPDIILTDLLMPKLDGFGVCRAIRANPQTAYIPVFVITAIIDRDVTLTALDAGADHVICKPFDLAELKLRVRKSVDRKVFIDELLQREVPPLSHFSARPVTHKAASR